MWDRSGDIAFWNFGSHSPNNVDKNEQINFANLWKLNIFKMSKGAFLIFPIFDNLVTLKRLVIERKGPTFGPLGQVFSAYRTVLLTVKYFIILRSFNNWYISDFRQSCISKKLGRRVKQTNSWTSGGSYLMYTGYFWQLSVQAQSVVIQCISHFWQDSVVTSGAIIHVPT